MLDHHRSDDIVYLHGKYEDISITIAFDLVSISLNHAHLVV